MKSSSSPRTPRAASPQQTGSTTVSAFTGCRRECSRRSPRCRSLCRGPEWSACHGGSTPTSCTSRRLHCWLWRTACCALSRCADRRGIPNGCRGIRGELRRRCRGTCRMGVDPPSAQPRRPHVGAIDVGDGKPCCASYPAGPQVGARRRHRRLRAVGARRAVAQQLVTGRQADRRVRRPARPREACRAPRGAGTPR